MEKEKTIKKQMTDELPLTFLPRMQLTDEAEKAAVLGLLTECDQDFYPPLSNRSSTSEKTLSGTTQGDNGVYSYYQEVLQQPVMIVKRGERIICFLSFRIGFTCEALKQYGPVCYLTTLCLTHDERGKGISPHVYRAVEEYVMKHYPDLEITLRTWNTNQAQMHLMKKLNYQLVATLKDHRGPGVDTVYFVKQK